MYLSCQRTNITEKNLKHSYKLLIEDKQSVIEKFL